MQYRYVLTVSQEGRVDRSKVQAVDASPRP